MKYLFLIIVILHGLIHLLGFVKGFDLREVKELTLPISKPMGILWLTTAIFFIAFIVSYLIDSKSYWLIGFIAVIFSQMLILLFWEDAKFGTIPNIIILIVSIVSFGDYNFKRMIEQETAQLLNKNAGSEVRFVNESDLGNLPEPVKKWLKNSGAIGKPFINCARVTQVAKMKMKPEQDNWMTATAIQYTTIDNPSFIWSVDVRMNSLLKFQGRDKYDEGKGEMLIKLNSLFNVVNERGEKIDEGSLQRYLGEMVWFPSLALSPFISWEQLDESTAKATMMYKGISGSGTFYFNSDGDVIKFSALRYKGNEPEAKKYIWEIDISEYQTFEGIKVPSKMTATWKLENRDWTWMHLEINEIKYNKNALK